MKEILKNIFLRILNLKKHIKIGKGCNIAWNSKFEGFNVINKNTTFRGIIGYASYLGSNCNINARIGRYTCIANGVSTPAGLHPTKDFISIHPAFFSTAKQAGFTYTKENLFKEDNDVDEYNHLAVQIGNDVWIGANATILGGLTIADGAIIAAGSVVIHDVGPYEIVGGNPARIKRKRFNDEEIDFLLADQWWNKEKCFLENMPEHFTCIDNYKEYLDEIK